jgi:glycine/D-amino acid oxidase-like deaminating enzyme
VREPDADVAVVGGGIVGLSCALHLLLRGRRVVLIDPGNARRAASFGNAGVIARGSIFPVAGPGVWRRLPAYACNADPALQLRYRALGAAAPWLRHFLARANEAGWRAAAAALDPLAAAAYDAHLHLAEATGAFDLIARCGYLKLYRTEAAFAASALEREILAHHRVRTEILDAQEIAAAEPALIRRFHRGVLFPESGAVDRPGELVGRYRVAFHARGGRAVEAACEALEPREAGVLVRWPGGALTTRQAVLAAGAWSSALARALGYRFPLAAERGYHRHYRVAQTLTRPVHDTGGAYVLSPGRDGSVRLLSGIEIARPEDPPNPRQLTRILPEAAATIALGEPLEAQPWCGSRPSTPDGLPIIGRAPRHPDLIFAFGHGHIGLSTGPITGRAVADIADRLKPPVPVEPFAPERFPR